VSGNDTGFGSKRQARADDVVARKSPLPQQDAEQ